MISDEYVAGLLDGEGCVTMVHRPRRDKRREGEWQSYVYVTFTMCDRAPLDAIQERFGGPVIALKRASERWRPAFRWQSAGPPAEAILRAARPYLLVKHRQADLALEFRDQLIQGGRTSPIRAKMNAEVHAHRLRLLDQMRELNRRGAA